MALQVVCVNKRHALVDPICGSINSIFCLSYGIALIVVCKDFLIETAAYIVQL